MCWEEKRRRLFNAVYDDTNQMLIRIAHRIVFDVEVAEELCHEAFIKLYERLDSLSDPMQIKYWLIRVVKNMAFNYSKRKGREKRAYEKVLNEPRPHIESGEDIALKQEAFLSVQQAVNKLPQKLREVLVLREYGQLNYREIAKVLKINEGNVKVRAFRARERVAAFLVKENIHVPE